MFNDVALPISSPKGITVAPVTFKTEKEDSFKTVPNPPKVDLQIVCCNPCTLECSQPLVWGFRFATEEKGETYVLTEMTYRRTVSSRNGREEDRRDTERGIYGCIQ